MTQERPLTLVTGGCGFVGRSLCRYLLREGHDLFVDDDLSTGAHPNTWLGSTLAPTSFGPRYAGPEGEGVVHFVEGDLIVHLVGQLGLGASEAKRWPSFAGVFHLAGIVGGRMKIDGDPLHVGLDLAIDALMFRWLTREPARVGRVLYASSSAAYPIDAQQRDGHSALGESLVDFHSGSIGTPDMSYGWSKLTGEFLAQLAAKHYGLSVACVRPFSGYGEEQATSYPIPALAERVARGDDPIEIWGDGEQGRDFVHIDDCVVAMHRAQLNIDDGSAVNIGTGKLTRFVDVARTLLSLDNRHAQLALRKDRPVGVMARYAEPTRMHELLAFHPQVSLREGLARVLEAARVRRTAHRAPTRVQPSSSVSFT